MLAIKILGSFIGEREVIVVTTPDLSGYEIVKSIDRLISSTSEYSVLMVSAESKSQKFNLCKGGAKRSESKRQSKRAITKA